MAGIMQRLRSETHDQHVSLERTVDLRSRFESRAGYCGLITRMLGLHEPLERALLRIDWSAAGIDMSERRKTGWLRQDLLALNLTEREIASIPRAWVLPELDTLAKGIGCLYVIEGSTLGGAVIARLLERVLKIDADHGGRFYASYGERLDPMWATFGAAADQWCADASAADQVCAAARHTFESFEAWFRRDQQSPLGA